jgi:isoleucyl-tRNA synthetase
LAEAEVEYENHTSPSIYVKFPVIDPQGKFTPDPEHGTFFVIWTTTPWTLPANQAIALHPDLIYRHVKTPVGELIMAQDLVPSLMKTFGFEKGDYKTTPGAWNGQELEGIICRHPWIDRKVRIVLGDYITKEQGTGCVHIAPGHGQEDYEVGQRYGLEVLAPVDAEGKFTPEAGELAGESVFKADRRVIDILLAKEAFIKEEKLSHSYPHCWRCKEPVIFRATEQWFISMEKNDLRHLSLESIDQVTWIPSWGRERIRGMLESRPDWCISRQRSWGVPIPVLYCKQCRQAHLSQEICDRVSSLFMEEGSDAWFLRPAGELLPPGFICSQCGGKEFSKEEDILDVWFDSGVSHAAVVERHPELGGRADLYLEGSDQHRGWFHTALLTSVGTRGSAPYRSVLTHGFTLDGEGRKMSKSFGNVISPQEIMKRSGAEILRLWVSAENYHDDVRISNEILNRLVEAYRKLRNTSRFLLGNLYDFDPEKDAVKPESFADLDRWILQRTQNLLSRCRDAYEKFEFHIVYHSLNNFCSVDLSSLYLDIVKDRLYCCAPTSRERRSAQTALYWILEVLVHLMAPVLSFTAEEIWDHMPKRKAAAESVLLSQITSPDGKLEDEKLIERWDQIFKERGELLKALEVARNNSIIGHSLDARMAIFPKDGAGLVFSGLLQNNQSEAEDILIVSQAEEGTGEPEGVNELKLAGDQSAHVFAGETSDGQNAKCLYYSAPLNCYIEVTKATAGKCDRCWKHHVNVDQTSHVCPRCTKVLQSLASA